jgi:adenylate cyclase
MNSERMHSTSGSGEKRRPAAPRKIVSEEIINALGQIEGLRVAARSSSFSFKRKSIEVSDIARRLDVRHVLEGSVRKAGTRVRVMAQLVNAANGFQLWSERYDRQIADIFDVQEEIPSPPTRRRFCHWRSRR